MALCSGARGPGPRHVSAIDDNIGSPGGAGAQASRNSIARAWPFAYAQPMFRRSLATVTLPLGILALVAGAEYAFALELDFAAMRSFETAREPASHATGDLNRDGFTDLVVASPSDNVLSILWGRADGTFGPQADRTAGYRPSSVAIGDLNGDGILDLAETNAGDLDTRLTEVATVGILLGRGDGTFADAVEYATGTTPWYVAIGDVNGDQRNDLVVANYGFNRLGPSTVSVLLGQGNGTFGSHTEFEVDRHPTFVVISDLDGDGDADLAVANAFLSITHTTHYDARISVLLGNGDGSFADHVDYLTPGVPRSIAVGDLNGDGRPDLAVASGRLCAFLGHGGGTFAASPADTTSPQVAGTSIALGDLNHDGILDFAATNGDRYGSTTGFVSVAFGRGDGAFEASDGYATPAAWSIGIEDLNRDGDADLTMLTFHGVSVLRGKGEGKFLAAQDYPDLSGGTRLVYSGDVALTDVNGDARLDIVATTYGRDDYEFQGVAVMLNREEGGFAPPVITPLPGAASFFRVADLDNDGRADVVVSRASNDETDSVWVMIGRGDGTFGLLSAFRAGHHPRSLAVGDLTHDGIPDLAVIHGQSAQLSILPGAGNGMLRAPVDIMEESGLLSPAIVDLNHDSVLDLVLADQDSDCLWVLTGTNGGTFPRRTSYPTGRSPHSVAVADLDLDGSFDLVVANYGSGTASILLGRNDGGFAPRVDYPTLREPSRTAIGDVDGDGHLDIAVSCRGGIVFLTGHGDGTFTRTTDFGFGRSNSYPLALGDVDCDGALDVVQSGPMSVLRNIGAAGAASRVPVLSSFDPARGEPGTRITIHGRHLTCASEVWVGAHPVARYALLADSLIEAVIDTVDEGGIVTITTPQGFASSVAAFDVLTPHVMPPDSAVTSFAVLAIGPSPVRDRLEMVLAIPAPGVVRLEALDITGRRVLQQSVPFPRAGVQRYVWEDFRTLRPGVYFVRVQQRNAVQRARAVVVR